MRTFWSDKLSFKYKGFDVELVEQEFQGEVEWFWRVLKGSNIHGEGYADSQNAARIMAERHADWVRENEEDLLEERRIERDRMWLEWATSFKIDELQGRSIKISSYPHLDGSRYWLVEWGGRHLSNSGWTAFAPKRYNDRESAYSAYLQWKQQEG